MRRRQHAPRDGGLTLRRAVLFCAAVALAGCRSSCTEETGAEPIVDTSEAGAPLGGPHAVRPNAIRIHPVMPMGVRSAAPANSE